MKTKRKTGTRFEYWVRDWLVENGATSVHVAGYVARVFRDKTGKIVTRNVKADIFGCIDVVAKSERKTFWIQATTGTHKKEKENKLLEVDWNLDVEEVQLWIKRKPGEVDVFSLESVKDGGSETYTRQLVLVGKIIRRKFYESKGDKIDGKRK